MLVIRASALEIVRMSLRYVLRQSFWSKCRGPVEGWECKSSIDTASKTSLRSLFCLPWLYFVPYTCRSHTPSSQVRVPIPSSIYDAHDFVIGIPPLYSSHEYARRGGKRCPQSSMWAGLRSPYWYPAVEKGSELQRSTRVLRKVGIVGDVEAAFVEAMEKPLRGAIVGA